MRKYTIKDLTPLTSHSQELIKYLPADWTGTVIDILNVKGCPVKHRLYAILDNEFLSDKELRLFAVWCSKESLVILEKTNALYSDTCDLAERYAKGEATEEELSMAYSRANDAENPIVWDFVTCEEVTLNSADRYASYIAHPSAVCAAWTAISNWETFAENSGGNSVIWNASMNVQIEKLKDLLLNENKI